VVKQATDVDAHAELIRLSQWKSTSWTKLSLRFAMRDTCLIGEVPEAYGRLISDGMRVTVRFSSPLRASSGCRKY
jgi:hypothetical protein